MITAEQLFTRWKELKQITGTTDTNTKAFKEAMSESDTILNDLHDGFHLLVAWDNDAKEWYLHDEKA